jgi:hypothetical protein
VIARPPRQSDADEMLDYLDEIHRFLSNVRVLEPGDNIQGAIDEADAGDTIMIVGEHEFESHS